MKWIAIAIVLFMGGYTYLTLHYRKPNRSYEPYSDIKTRGQTHNLLTAGYRRITLNAELPTNEPAAPATAYIKTVFGGIPTDLANSLFDQPQLPDSYQGVQAPAQISALLPVRIIFDCLDSSNNQQLSAAHLYVRDGKIFIVPEFEKLEGELLSRNRTNHVQLVVPGGTLAPGGYQIQLVGRDASLIWAMQVN